MFFLISLIKLSPYGCNGMTFHAHQKKRLLAYLQRLRDSHLRCDPLAHAYAKARSDKILRMEITRPQKY